MFPAKSDHGDSILNGQISLVQHYFNGAFIQLRVFYSKESCFWVYVASLGYREKNYKLQDVLTHLFPSSNEIIKPSG